MAKDQNRSQSSIVRRTQDIIGDSEGGKKTPIRLRTSRQKAPKKKTETENSSNFSEKKVQRKNGLGKKISHGGKN